MTQSISMDNTTTNTSTSGKSQSNSMDGVDNTTRSSNSTQAKNEETSSTTSTSSSTSRLAASAASNTTTSSLGSSSTNTSTIPDPPNDAKPTTPPPITRKSSYAVKSSHSSKNKSKSPLRPRNNTTSPHTKHLRKRFSHRNISKSVRDFKKAKEEGRGGDSTSPNTNQRLVEYFVVISSVPRKNAPPQPPKNGTPPPPPPPSDTTTTQSTNATPPPPSPKQPPTPPPPSPPTIPPTPHTSMEDPPKLNPRVASRLSRLSVHLDPPPTPHLTTTTPSSSSTTTSDLSPQQHANIKKSIKGTLLRTLPLTKSKSPKIMETLPEKEETSAPPPPIACISTTLDNEFVTSNKTFDSMDDSSSLGDSLYHHHQDLNDFSFDSTQQEEEEGEQLLRLGSTSSIRLKSVDKDGKVIQDLNHRESSLEDVSLNNDSSSYSQGIDDASVCSDGAATLKSKSNLSAKKEKAKEKMMKMKKRLKNKVDQKLKKKEKLSGVLVVSSSNVSVGKLEEEEMREIGRVSFVESEDESLGSSKHGESNLIGSNSIELIKRETEPKQEQEEKNKDNEEEEEKELKEAEIQEIKQELHKNTTTSSSSQNIHLPTKTPYNPSSPTPPPLYFQPSITAQYPPVDHPDSPLNPMLPHFCFPYSDVISLSLDYRMPRIHHFVLTNDMGKKIYGTCLTVYEEYIPPSPPKKEEEEEEEQTTTTTTTTTPKKNGCYGAVQDSKTNEKAHNESIEVLISDTYPHTMYVPRVLCLLSTWPYLTAFREYLTQLYRLATSTNMMKGPLERYILNLCAEIPAPPPGAFEIRMSILNSTIRFWAPPANQPIPYVALPFGLLFECLDIGNILFVWYSLALERKVLLVSSQYSILTVCAEILCSLLFPMQWSHLYIPILPRFLSPMLDAPMPYLCGISRDNLPYAVGDINDETIVVDLDQNVVTMGPLTQDLPPIPHKRRVKLEMALEANVGDVFWQARGVTKKRVAKIQKYGDESAMDRVLDKAGTLWAEKLSTFDEAFNLAYTPDSPNLLINDESFLGATKRRSEQSQWDAVQEAFLRFYVALLKDYRKFLSEEDKDDPNSGNSKSTKRWGPRRDFKTEDFIKSQRVDFQPFLEELCITQQFDDFVTKRMYSPGEPDVIFFDQSIDAKLNRSRLKLKKVDTPYLHSSKAHKALNTIDAVEPNTDDLPEDDTEGEKDKFMYKMWPETFDAKLYGEPRPIPKIISAEFDRQSELAGQLRDKYADLDDDDDLMELYDEDCDPNPEVATFTVFFMTYTAIIGDELKVFEQKKKDLDRCLQDEEGISTSAGAAAKSTHSMENGGIAPKMRGSEADGGVMNYMKSFTNDMTSQHVYESFGEHIEEVGSNLCCSDSMCDTDAIVKTLCDREHNRDTAQTSIDVGEEKSYFDLFFGKVDHSLTLRDSAANGVRSRQDEGNVGMSALTEFEEARAFAKAQMDLAFDALMMLRTRGLTPDPDVYRCMMDICSRSGDIGRVTLLLSMINEDGLVVDSEMYWRFMGAYSTATTTVGGFGGEGLGISNTHLPSALASSKTPQRISPKKHSWRKSFSSAQKKAKKLGVERKTSTLSDTDSSDSTDSDSEDTSMADSIGTKSSVGGKSTVSTSTTATATVNATDTASNNVHSEKSVTKSSKSSTEKKKSHKKKSSLSNPNKKKSKKSVLLMTDGMKTQVALGENLLEVLYPDLRIDTNNSCPTCFKNLKQDHIAFGWTPCDFQDYNTICPQCDHGFVPRFSVKCKSPTFVGSQGKSTPLYCEFLSPWVLRKQLLSLMKSEDGVNNLLDPEWRNDAGINATLWWNLIASFRRYKLPLTYLLQGSFSQKLIMPVPDMD